jgi:ribosomal protein S18 acetylase RimI-like enzyme
MGPDAYRPHALVTAAAAAQVSWASSVAQATGGRVWREGVTLCVHQPVPHDQLLLLFPARIDAGTVDRVLTWCAEAGVRTAGCWSSGLGDDAAVGEILESRGFEEGWRPHWMALELPRRPTAATAADPRVTEVSAVPEYDSYGQALLRMPDTHHFVAREDGAPAGFAWLHLPDTAPGAGGLFDVVVPEPARRRGLGSALTRAACARARELGRRDVVLNATGDGQALYTALGFRSLGHGRTWWLHRGSG